MPKSTIKAGELKRLLATMPPDAVVTFGSSSFSRRPLVFFRTKKRGEKLLCIEVNELFDDPENFLTPEPEHEHRLTAGDLLKDLDVPDDWDIAFGTTIDGRPLEFQALHLAVAIDLRQTGKPEWRRQPR